MLFYRKTYKEAFLSANVSDQPSVLDDLLPPRNSSSNASSSSFPFPCFRSRDSVIIFSTFTLTHLLLILSFVTFFCYLRFHRRRRHRSKPPVTHSDHFTFQSIAMQLIEFLGFIVFFCGGYTNHSLMIVVGVGFIVVTSTGQALFHLCTCVERYLAVVHPIVYLGLSHSTRVRIRNITIGCVWMLSLGWTALVFETNSTANLIFYLCIVIFSLALVTFCSISVLCVLKRPGPGEGGQDREQVDQSKLRAFRTIMVIMGVLLVRFAGSMLSNLLYAATPLSPSNSCVMSMCTVWFSLPSSVMLPLLYLHRSGNLPCGKQSTEAGK